MDPSLIGKDLSGLDSPAVHSLTLATLIRHIVCCCLLILDVV